MSSKRTEELSGNLFEKDTLKWGSDKNKKSKKNLRSCSNGTKECRCGRICRCETTCKCGRICADEN